MNKEQRKKLEEMLTPQALVNLRNKKIKQTGKKVWSIPKLGIKRISNFYHKMKDKLYSYVSEDEINKLQQKSHEQEQIIDTLKSMEQENPYVSLYTEAQEQAKVKTDKKIAKISGKNLSVFALSALAIKKISKESIEKAQNKIQAKKESIKQGFNDKKNSIKETLLNKKAELLANKEKKSQAKIDREARDELDYLFIAMQNHERRGEELQQRYKDLAEKLGINNEYEMGYESESRLGR